MTLDLGRFGVFVHEPISPERAREIETLGYGTVWVAGPPAAELAFVEPILRATMAREVLRATVGCYLGLSNYRKNWERLGFTDADLTPPGSDRLYDALIAHGFVEHIAKRLTAHLDAGADHVAIDVQGGPETVLPSPPELAGPLGLAPPR